MVNQEILDGARDGIVVVNTGRGKTVDAEAMVESLSRLATLDEGLTVLPGHGGQTTIGREKPWLQMVAQERKLPF